MVIVYFLILPVRDVLCMFSDGLMAKIYKHLELKKKKKKPFEEVSENCIHDSRFINNHLGNRLAAGVAIGCKQREAGLHMCHLHVVQCVAKYNCALAKASQELRKATRDSLCFSRNDSKLSVVGKKTVPTQFRNLQ